MKTAIIVLLVLVVAFGAWYFYHHKSNSQTQSAVISGSTEEVVTASYANQKYGFAFDYPKTYGTSTMIFTGKDVHDPADANARFDGKLNPVGLTVQVDLKPKNFSNSYFEAQFVSEKKERANATFTLSTTTVNVGGNSVFAVQGTGNGKDEEEILMEHGSYIFSVGYTLPSGTQNAAIQTVLNTFRFLP